MMNLDVGVLTNLKTVRQLLASEPEASLHFALPDGSRVPAHIHVTEVGRVRKDFIDCGGTVRSSERCVLQLWVADDEPHRLVASKLARIIALALPLLGSETLAVEVEYDMGVITQLPISGADATAEGILFHLGEKHTACLAPQLCCLPASAGGGKCC